MSPIPPATDGPARLAAAARLLAEAAGTARDDLLEAEPVLSPPGLQRRVDDLVDGLVDALDSLAVDTGEAAARADLLARSRRREAPRPGRTAEDAAVEEAPR